MSGDREDRLIEELGEPEDFVWQSLHDAVTNLALGGRRDAPAEALHRLCEGQWIAQGEWRWWACAGEVYESEGQGVIPVERWKCLSDGIDRGFEGAPLPTFSNGYFFAAELPHYEIGRWSWRQNRFEYALLSEPDREDCFCVQDIYVCVSPPVATTLPLEPALASARPSRASSAVNKGGRPPVADWEAAALEMAGRYYRGELKPATVADVVRALQEWATESGNDLADATAKPHAKRIFDAFRAWEAD